MFIALPNLKLVGIKSLSAFSVYAILAPIFEIFAPNATVDGISPMSNGLLT